MLWVGIATLVMLITGDGNDARQFAKLHAHLLEQVAQVVTDADRERAALEELAAMKVFFVEMRAELSSVGACIEALDRRYDVTAADYEACHLERDTRWEKATALYGELKTNFRSYLTDEEWAELHLRLLEGRAR